MSGPVALLPDQPARYLASLLMLTNYWTLPHEMTAGTNGPFWSLSYEMTYYVLFGLFLLPARRWAWIAAIGVGLLAGPYILGLFPLWLLGVAVYRRPHLISISTPAAAFLFVLSVALLFKIGWYNGAWPPERGQPWHLDYAEGVLFAVNILAVRRLSGFLEAILGPFSSAIRWLGMLTFAIYLCHRPLLQFFSALRIGEPGSAAQQAWLFGGTAIVIITIAHFSNWLRPRLAGFILGLPALRPAIRSAGD
jgi:peptidoglycan/LPS O-acetylase OafA/YrhL